VQARIAPAAAGLPITAFYLLQVAQNAETYESTAILLRDVDQVEEAHAVSGRYDWLVKVRARDVVDLQRLLVERLALLPGFVRAETMVVHSSATDVVNVPAALYPPET
jgi:DNA-binding Lrp family transcriptional regulator